MLCYGDNEVNYITNYLWSKNIKCVLWGCSFGKENLTEEKKKVLGHFTLITARESMTYHYLKDELKLNNVYLYPDPAFVLLPEKCSLMKCFSRNLVGINLSNFVGGNIDISTLFGKNIINLLNYILEMTEYDIVFIPHVFWDGQDDRIACAQYYEIFKNSSRVHLLDSEKLNYCQIRYAISKCRFFIGARTHAMISAYSMKVPSIALGYSIKSKGIAKDLNLPDFTVLDYRSMETNNTIVERFINLQKQEIEIKKLLESEMPSYVANAYKAKVRIEEL